MAGSAEDDVAGSALMNVLLWPLYFIVAFCAAIYGNFDPMTRLFGGKIEDKPKDKQPHIDFSEDA